MAWQPWTPSPFETAPEAPPRPVHRMDVVEGFVNWTPIRMADLKAGDLFVIDGEFGKPFKAHADGFTNGTGKGEIQAVPADDKTWEEYGL